MGTRTGPLVIAAITLAAGLSGCATSTTTATAGATTRAGATTTTSPAPPTVSPPSVAPSTPSAPATAPRSSAPAAEQVLLSIKGFTYTTPASVRPGAKVTVKNDDLENHTVTSAKPGTFDVKATAGGQSITFTAPTRPGRYPFICAFHSNMTGTLVVR